LKEEEPVAYDTNPSLHSRGSPVAQIAAGDRDESATAEGAGEFINYAFVLLNCLQIYLDTSYRMSIDLLKTIPQIIEWIDRVMTDFSSSTTLYKAFD
jgi:IS5 family transposase